MDKYEITILMPCLNEEHAIGYSIGEAKAYIGKSGISAEILVADNGSTDSSCEIAHSMGARVVHIEEKGYGNALRGGIAQAKGRNIIMGDADGSYDFSNLDIFIEKLREGYTLVMGNRYLGGIECGAMPPLHQYLGVPVLSWLGRKKYHTEIGDFHCGLRAFHTEKAKELGLKSGGMEFATEIIGAFAKADERICEVPVVLRKDRRCGKSHLRTVRDGMRHVRLILFDK